MTAIPLDPVEHRADERPARGRRPLVATLYFWLVVAAAAVTVVPVLTRLGTRTPGWTTFTILGIAIAVAQIFAVEAPANQAYHTTAVFLVAAALLLPPELVALVAAVQHVPDWLKRRHRLEIQTFSIASWTLTAMAVWLAARLIEHSHPLGAGGPTVALAGASACIVFVSVNRALLAPMLRFARGHSLRESGLFTAESLLTELSLAALGVALAVLWRNDVWLLPFVAAPLVLVHRSLAVPTLEAEARIDGKTGLFNARHFAGALREELERAIRVGRPMSVVMADLDLLRDINNTYGHLAGDAVLSGVAQIFRAHLREYDVAARFGGEEFSIILPETGAEEALRIADRIRREVAVTPFEVPTSGEPVRATLSIGVACYPSDAGDAEELVHQADLAVYRAKVQGRNRAVPAPRRPLVAEPERDARRLVALSDASAERIGALPAAPAVAPTAERPARRRPRIPAAPALRAVDRRLAALVCVVGVAGVTAGLYAFGLPGPQPSGLAPAGGLDAVGLLAVLVLVALGQAMSIEVERMGTISVGAVGALAGAAIVGPRAALPVAVTIAAVEWSARRSRLHQVVFNVGALTLASLAATAVFALPVGAGHSAAARVAVAALGLLAGITYFLVNTGLLAVAVGLETLGCPHRVWRERFSWLVTHYLAYGFVAAMILEAYRAIGVWAIVVFLAPLLVIREAQGSYVRHTERAAAQLREAAETINTQNVSLEQANRLLRERSTAAMESLSATVDARDAYTAGHSRRVRNLALGIGRELGLSTAELETVGQAALFHDIGKLAVPEAILLKPDDLSDGEWALVQRHAEEGASIVDRLGFLGDAVPAIRHHHERFDGSGYPDGLAGEDIPLGARIIHVADAFDSMLSTRVYRAARPLDDALAELHEEAGSQFCPRCVTGLEGLLAKEGIDPASLESLRVGAELAAS